MNWQLFKNHIIVFFSEWGVIAIKLALLFLVGFLVIKATLKITNKVMAKNQIEKTARRFFYNFIKFGLYLALAIIMLNATGISTTIFVITLLVVATTLAVAFMNSLVNLSSGLVLIITKQIKEDEIIEINGEKGKVSEIKLTHSIITNKIGEEIIIPNKVFLESIVYKSKTHHQKTFNQNHKTHTKNNVTTKGLNKIKQQNTQKQNKEWQNRNHQPSTSLENKSNKPENAETKNEVKVDKEHFNNKENSKQENKKPEKEYLDYTDEIEIIEEMDLEEQGTEINTNQVSLDKLNEEKKEVFKMYSPSKENEREENNKPNIKKTKFGFLKTKKNKNKKTPIVIKK